MQFSTASLLTLAVLAVGCSSRPSARTASVSSMNPARYRVPLPPSPWPVEPTGPAPAVRLDPSSDSLDRTAQGTGGGRGSSPENSTVGDQPAPSSAQLIDTDACPSPLDASRFDEWEDRAFKLPPGPDVLFVMQTSPSFFLGRALSLYRRSDGAYVLRSTRLTEGVDNDSAVHRTPATEVSERFLDSTTAQLLLDVWQALTQRAKVVRSVGLVDGKLDGVAYRIWHRGTGVRVHSPSADSVLDQAIAGVERLGELVAKIPKNERNELLAARRELRDALERTRRKEPCLRPP